MPEQVLVHLVRPRCVVASIELLCWKRARYSSVHFFFSSVLHPRLGYVYFGLLSAIEALNPRALIPCKELCAEDMQKTEYRTEGLMESLELKNTEYAVAEIRECM